MDRREQLAKYRQMMYDAEAYIWKHPETGFREWNTHAYLKQRMQELGYQLTEAGNIPGFIAEMDTGREGPTVALLAEMDSVINFSHPECDPKTGAVHACGHHAQCAALLGAAALFSEKSASDGLCGKIRFVFEPAEELLEIGYREELRKQGVIEFFGGKVEFMRRGLMDDVDLVVMLHTGDGVNRFGLTPGQNGCMVKQIAYHGRSAHAGGAPHRGINALYAANLGMSAVNSLRETFRDDDHIRFHPIVTGQPGAVNVIPSEVTLESYVRGASLDAMLDANRRVNRALAGAAAAMGATVTLTDRPGYSPVDNDKNMYEATKKVMTMLVGAQNVEEIDEWSCGSTDMGDISCVWPAIHPHGSGAEGDGHGANYVIADRESAVVLAAAFLAGMCDELLENGAASARYIMENAHTQYKSAAEYIDMLRSLSRDIEGVRYTDKGALLDY